MSGLDNRPEWQFKEMPEAFARDIRDFGRVVSVSAKWEMTSADTAREWLEATNQSGAVLILPNGWKAVLAFAGHSSVPGLFEWTYLGKRMLDRLTEIDGWEAKNARDRSEFERLKAKFGT